MLKNRMISTMVFGIFTAIMMQISVFGIVWFAIKHRITAMGLAIGIVIISFYLLPFIWTRYAMLFKYSKVYDAIEVKGLRTLSEIASYTLMDEKSAEDLIKRCISYGYIEDKIFFDKIVSNKKDIRVHNRRISCPSCGACEFKSYSGYYECLYCSTRVSKK